MLEEVVEAIREKPLIVYNWNPDSLISTILTLTYATSNEEARVLALDDWRPSIKLLENIAVKSREAKSLVLVGLGWSGPEIDLLAPMVLAPVVVIDQSWHQLRPRRPNVIYYNPSPKGERIGNWPSVSSLVSIALKHPHPFLAASGIVSVMGETAKSNRLYQTLMTMAGLDHNSDYELAYDCAMQAYGITSMGEPGIHGEVAMSIVEAGVDPCKAMLKDALLTSMRGSAEVTLEEAISNASVRENGGLTLVEAKGYGRHAFYVARHYALKYRDRVVLTLYEDNMTGRRTACAWSISDNKPLAALYPSLRGLGYKVIANYHGLVNYICYTGKAPARKLAEDFLAAASKGG